MAKLKISTPVVEDADRTAGNRLAMCVPIYCFTELAGTHTTLRRFAVASARGIVVGICLGWLGKLGLMLFLASGTLLQTAHAGWLAPVREAMSNKIHYYIRVLDDHGQPLAGAALWSSSRGEEGQADWKAVMTRVLQRYAADYDYARPLGLMRSRMLVEYVDQNGELHWEWKTDKRPPLVFVAVKRGFHPALIEVQAQLNPARELVFHLKRNSTESVDPRMEAFDRLRADVFNSQDFGMMADAREAFIQSRQKEMRRLAASLEADRPELAARVYLNLADLPSVDVFRRVDGTVIGRGFTNGFNESEPQRLADFEKGLELDQLTPELQVVRITHRENKEKIRLNPNEKKMAAMHDGLANVVSIVANAPERVWPSTYAWLVYRYMALEDYGSACLALQTGYAFESASESTETWQSMRREVQRNAEKLGLKSSCWLTEARE